MYKCGNFVTVLINFVANRERKGPCKGTKPKKKRRLLAPLGPSASRPTRAARRGGWGLDGGAAGACYPAREVLRAQPPPAPPLVPWAPVEARVRVRVRERRRSLPGRPGPTPGRRPASAVEPRGRPGRDKPGRPPPPSAARGAHAGSSAPPAALRGRGPAVPGAPLFPSAPPGPPWGAGVRPARAARVPGGGGGAFLQPPAFLIGDAPAAAGGEARRGGREGGRGRGAPPPPPRPPRRKNFAGVVRAATGRGPSRPPRPPRAEGPPGPAGPPPKRCRRRPDAWV